MGHPVVHWSEGLFLQPHHFQTAERRLREELAISENALNGYAYGLRKIEIDHDALANWRVSLRSFQGRFPDGTHVRVPDDGQLNPIQIPREAFSRQDRVLVYAAIPQLRLGRQNSDTTGTDPHSRYLVGNVEVEDENEPGKSQRVDVRWPNVRLMLTGEERAGYEVLPVMSLRRGAMAESVPEIDPDYIPPILACDAWDDLQSGILGSIYHQIASAADRLAAQISDRGIAFESGHREDLERLLRLQSLNSALGVVSQLPYLRGVHPLTAYLELCRAVGFLALFQGDRRLPEIPRYDHDNLGFCFLKVRQLLEPKAVGPDLIKRPFIGAGLQLQVRLEREWLQPDWKFFIGIDSPLGFDQLMKLLNSELNMKVGSTRQVDRTFAQGRAGVELIPEREAPRSLPGKTWSYLQVKRDSPAWSDVDDTLTLGVRINDRQIEGRIDGEQTIRIRTDNGQEAVMTFALFAVPAATS